MLSASDIRRIYYVPGVVSMSWGFYRLIEFVTNECHVIPHTGDCFIYMSRNRRRVKVVYFDQQAYYVNEKTYYDKDYHFMKVEFREKKCIYSIEWKDLVAILENPVLSVLRL